VIFDLFGTLVATFSAVRYRRLLADMAQAAGAPADEFSRLWLETCDQRWSGAFSSTEANVDYICRALGIQATPDCVAEAARLRLPVVELSLKPRSDAVSTLTRLRAAGCRIGLISDCSHEVPQHWPRMSIAPLVDAPVFSCLAGVKKPDPRIYHIACRKLGVEPEQCIYVGDGGSRELSGAAQVGMHAVLIRVPQEDPGDAHRVEAEEWRGTRIQRLGELPSLAGLE